MAAKGKKKTKSKAAVKRIAPKKEEEEDEDEDEDFDLETMEKMLENDNDTDENEDSIDEDIMDDANNDDDDESVDENDQDESETEVSSDEEETEVPFQNEPTDDAVEGEEKCSLDLRNLTAINSHQVNHRLLYTEKSNEEDEAITICVNGMMKANDDYLMQKANEGCSQLLAGLWNLDTEKTDAGPMAVLPTYFEIITPRELVSCETIPVLLYRFVIERNILTFSFVL